MNRKDRIKGGLFGVAVGDALGGTLEFLGKEEGKKEYGYHKEIIGGGLMQLKPGEVTDDTMMTIAVAKGILENPESPIKFIGDNFIQWYESRPTDIGQTCEMAIRYFKECGNWDEAAEDVHNDLDERSAGNGTLMRCIPAALYYRRIKDVRNISKIQSKMTHYDNKASDACIIYNTIVYKYLRGGEKIKVIKDALKGYKEYENIFETRKEQLRASGYVVDTLKCALWCFINNLSFEDTVCEAVNMYGDPDTIGAIAGGLAGAYYGYDEIPTRWREKIILKDEIMELCDKLNGH